MINKYYIVWGMLILIAFAIFVKFCPWLPWNRSDAQIEDDKVRYKEKEK